jgi:hypothetical protein
MNKMIKDPIVENFVNHVWDKGYFIKNNLRAKDGRKIEILCPGEWNTDSGADFRNASIKVDGEICKGDVEVHVRSSDWRIHHHDKDPKYNSTILHVALRDSGINLLAKKQNGDRIPTLVLFDYLDRSIGRLWKAMENNKNSYPCLDKVSKKADTLCSILDNAGMERLNSKSKAFQEQFGIKGENQALYEGLMDALGYSKNREQFRELANKVPIEFLRNRTIEEIQAILFGVAGLLPSQNRDDFDKETEAYINGILPIWENFSSKFRGEIMLPEQWNFFRLRPENFPTIRIAGLSYIITDCKEMSLMAGFLSSIDKIDHNAPISQVSLQLRKILMPSASGYWSNHYNFRRKGNKQSKFLIGKNRADDIVINVILPAIMAYAQIIQDDILLKKIMQFYSNYPTLQDNSITRFFIERVFRSQGAYSELVNSALRQQGLIHIYKSSCSAKDCINCPFM